MLYLAESFIYYKYKEIWTQSQNFQTTIQWNKVKVLNHRKKSHRKNRRRFLNANKWNNQKMMLSRNNKSIKICTKNKVQDWTFLLRCMKKKR